MPAAKRFSESNACTRKLGGGRLCEVTMQCKEIPEKGFANVKATALQLKRVGRLLDGVTRSRRQPSTGPRDLEASLCRPPTSARSPSSICTTNRVPKISGTPCSQPTHQSSVGQEPTGYEAVAATTFSGCQGEAVERWPRNPATTRSRGQAAPQLSPPRGAAAPQPSNDPNAEDERYQN